MIKKIKSLLKLIFHFHEWTLDSQSYETIGNKAYNVWYNFKCKKCNLRKTVKTKGEDVFTSIYGR